LNATSSGNGPVPAWLRRGHGGDSVAVRKPFVPTKPPACGHCTTPENCRYRSFVCCSALGRRRSIATSNIPQRTTQASHAREALRYDEGSWVSLIYVPAISVPLLVRRAKLGFASQGRVLTPEVLARYRVPRVASVKVTTPTKRTQGGDGPQCASVKGLSPVMNG